jgi:hypothetical protein
VLLDKRSTPTTKLGSIGYAGLWTLTATFAILPQVRDLDRPNRSCGNGNGIEFFANFIDGQTRIGAER